MSNFINKVKELIPTFINKVKELIPTMDGSSQHVIPTNAIVKSIRENLASNQNVDKLIIWLSGNLQLASNNNDYKSRLELEGVNNFEVVEVKVGTPQENGKKYNIQGYRGGFLQFVQTTNMLSVDVVDNCGSLDKNSKKIIEGIVGHKYNIGRGVNPPSANGRHNDIAIDMIYDHQPETDVEKRNSRVSRTHAHIGYHSLGWFYLQPDNGGINNNSTDILRNGRVITLNSQLLSEKLEDEDIIRLGGDNGVYLKVHITKLNIYI